MMLQVRRQHPAFGRGEMCLLVPANRSILAYLRAHDPGLILVVSNLSQYTQVAELDLAAWAGRQPVDLFTGERLAPVGAAPYPVRLAPYGYLWLQLEASAIRENI